MSTLSIGFACSLMLVALGNTSGPEFLNKKTIDSYEARIVGRQLLKGNADLLG